MRLSSIFWVALVGLLWACGGDDDDDDDDDDGATAEEEGLYAPILGTWAGEMEQSGEGTYYGELDVTVDDAEPHDVIGTFYQARWDNSQWCTYEFIHVEVPEDGTWLLRNELIDNPQDACIVDGVGEEPTTRLILEEGPVVVYESTLGHIVGLLEPL